MTTPRLIDNAIKFGTYEGHVQVKLEEQDSAVIIAVQDDGIVAPTWPPRPPRSRLDRAPGSIVSAPPASTWPPRPPRSRLDRAPGSIASPPPAPTWPPGALTPRPSGPGASGRGPGAGRPPSGP